MSTPATPLLVNIADSNKSGIVSSIFSTAPGGTPRFIDSSGENFSISAIKPTSNSSSGRYYDFVALESARASGSIILALGDLEEAPTSGTWNLSYGGDATGLTTLSYNAAAIALQNALNANPGFIAGGFTCTVSKVGLDYEVTMNQVGARSLLATDGSNLLLPSSSVFVYRKTVGDSTTKDAQIIRLIQKPAAMQTVWAALAGVTSAGVILTAGATAYLWTMAMPDGAYSGAASVVVTINSVASTFVANWNDTAATVQLAIEALANVGSGKVTVTGSQGGPFGITFDPTLNSSITLVGTNINLAVPVGVTGWLNPNTDVMAEKFNSAGSPDSLSLNLALQIQYPDDPYPRTVLQISATVYKSVINTATIVPVSASAFYTSAQADARFLAKSQVVFGTMTAGADTGSVDISALGLTVAPTTAVFLGLGKHAAGDANITGSVIISTMTASSISFELNALTDNANRIPIILVIP